MAHLNFDKPKYFEIQYLNSKGSIVPFVSDFFSPEKGKRVMEIGSAEGGVISAFLELDCQCLGVELSPSRVNLANEFLKEQVLEGSIAFVAKDIFDFSEEELKDQFDLVILKDVIEHIHDQEKFMKQVEKFLKVNGKIFFGFPAWRMPYGGHQQIAKSKIASKLPYYHILPKGIYRGMLKLFGESPRVIESLLEIKDTRISTRRFEKICVKNDYKVIKRTKYFVAPIYEYKFNYKTKKLWRWVGVLPWINDFFTFQSYYLIEKSEKNK
ncbi:MAG: class I SAM-dependent methyltransferase [Flavobacteriales bacterium]|nr:class I SAM-dependent methyltransferase [Flavobacteriales bacterium]